MFKVFINEKMLSYLECLPLYLQGLCFTDLGYVRALGLDRLAVKMEDNVIFNGQHGFEINIGSDKFSNIAVQGYYYEINDKCGKQVNYHIMTVIGTIHGQLVHWAGARDIMQKEIELDMKFFNEKQRDIKKIHVTYDRHKHYMKRDALNAQWDQINS